jgi:hypothetical protein
MYRYTRSDEKRQEHNSPAATLEVCIIYFHTQYGHRNLKVNCIGSMANRPHIEC